MADYPNARLGIALVADPSLSTYSRFGGNEALLPPGVEWPEVEGRKMLLLVQIDLSEARAAAPSLRSELPPEGLLQAFFDPDVFFDSDISLECGKLEEMRGVRLLLHPFSDLLLPRPGPGYPEADYGVRFHPQHTLPEDDIPELEGGDDDEAWTIPLHQMLGHPFPLQNDALAWCNRLKPPGGRVLVLQLGSDDDLNWMFGDVGNLYFMASGDSFAKGELRDAYLEFQCH